MVSSIITKYRTYSFEFNGVTRFGEESVGSYDVSEYLLEDEDIIISEKMKFVDVFNMTIDSIDLEFEDNSIFGSLFTRQQFTDGYFYGIEIYDDGSLVFNGYLPKGGIYRDRDDGIWYLMAAGWMARYKDTFNISLPFLSVLYPFSDVPISYGPNTKDEVLNFLLGYMTQGTLLYQSNYNIPSSISKIFNSYDYSWLWESNYDLFRFINKVLKYNGAYLTVNNDLKLEIVLRNIPSETFILDDYVIQLDEYIMGYSEKYLIVPAYRGSGSTSAQHGRDYSYTWYVCYYDGKSDLITEEKIIDFNTAGWQQDLLDSRAKSVIPDKNIIDLRFDFPMVPYPTSSNYIQHYLFDGYCYSMPLFENDFLLSEMIDKYSHLISNKNRIEGTINTIDIRQGQKVNYLGDDYIIEEVRRNLTQDTSEIIARAL